MPGKSRMVQLGMMLVLILALTGLDRSYGAAAADQGPDQAMRSFIDAVVRKDKSAVLSFFSPSSPWQYVGHEIGTGKVIATKMVNYPVMTKDFASKKGWYGFFFDEPNGYTFRMQFPAGRDVEEERPEYLCLSAERFGQHLCRLDARRRKVGHSENLARPALNRLSDIKLAEASGFPEVEAGLSLCGGAAHPTFG